MLPRLSMRSFSLPVEALRRLPVGGIRRGIVIALLDGISPRRSTTTCLRARQWTTAVGSWKFSRACPPRWDHEQRGGQARRLNNIPVLVAKNSCDLASRHGDMRAVEPASCQASKSRHHLPGGDALLPMGEFLADDLQVVAVEVDGLVRAEIEDRTAIGHPTIAVEAENGGAGLEIADHIGCPGG